MSSSAPSLIPTPKGRHFLSLYPDLWDHAYVSATLTLLIIQVWGTDSQGWPSCLLKFNTTLKEIHTTCATASFSAIHFPLGFDSRILVYTQQSISPFPK